MRITGRVDGHSITITAYVCGMADIRPIDPPGEQHHTVCWIETDDGFGGMAPGTNSGTTYIFGHAWAEDPLEVLNKISAPATREILAGRSHPKYVSGVPTYPATSLNGLLVTLWTPRGTLIYKVRDAWGVAKTQAADVAPLMNNKTKNRIVLFTCAELNGTDYEYNVIVDAYLFSSKKRPATT
jgi:hypothetical protein